MIKAISPEAMRKKIGKLETILFKLLLSAKCQNQPHFEYW